MPKVIIKYDLDDYESDDKRSLALALKGYELALSIYELNDFLKSKINYPNDKEKIDIETLEKVQEKLCTILEDNNVTWELING